MTVVGWLYGIVILGGTIALALVVGALVDRWAALRRLAEDHNKIVEPLLRAVTAVFGILLSFLISASVERRAQVVSTVNQEISDIADLYRVAPAFPPPTGPELSDELGAYYREIIEGEWPLLARGQPSAKATALLEELWRMISSFEAITPRERSLQSFALERLARASGQRRSKLLASTSRMPSVVWALIVVGATVAFAFTGLLRTAHPRTKAAMVSAFALVLAMAILTIAVLQQPFGGPLPIRADEIVHLLEKLHE